MPSKGFLVLAYFIVLAIINFVIYAKLCNYMYMAAGVKKEDVRKFLSEQVSTHSQRQLVRWLRRKADNSKGFNTMFFFCSATSFISFITPILIFFIVMLKLDFNVVKIIMIVEAVITVLLAVFGFLNGKRIKEEKEFYFESSEYKPYEGENIPDQIDDLDELYYDSEDGTYTESDSDEREKKKRKGKVLIYVIKIIIVIIMLMFLFSPIIFKNVRFKLGNSNYNQNNYAQSEEFEAESEEFPQNVNITSVRNKVEEAGYTIGVSLEEREKQYPNYLFEDTFCVDENEMYIEYLKMVNNEDAINLYHDLKDELVETYSKDKDKDIITKDKQKNRTLYALENDDGYAIVIRDKESVIYAHCDKLQSTWLKCFMYELGYLKTF